MECVCVCAYKRCVMPASPPHLLLLGSELLFINCSIGSIFMAALVSSKEEAVVNVERVRTVTPVTKSEVSTMFLSTCDLVCRTYPYINRVFFYEVGGRSDYEAFVTTLEQGLSKTLVAFYPLAGRLSHDDSGRLHIECNDAGAEFFEASLSPPISFSHFVQNNFQYTPLFWKLAPKSDWLRSDYPHEPLLSIQVTSLLDGGVALGVSMSHILADAQSFYDFMRCWAEMCRSGSMSLPPKHMRGALSVKEMFHEDAQLCNGQENGHFPIIEKATQDEELRRPKPGLAQRYFPFSSQLLQQLKAKANSDETLCKNGTKFTTFESFCAHWWQSIIRARSLPSDQLVCLLIPVNCRQRFLSLPKTLFGNALDGALVKYSAAELCEAKLSAITGKIHEAIKAATEDRFKKYIKEAEVNNGAVFHFDRTELFHIMDSPQFPIYTTDFGFGAPKAIRAEGSRYGCEVQIIPGRLGPGSFDFFVGLDVESMERLVQDPNFAPC